MQTVSNVIIHKFVYFRWNLYNSNFISYMQCNVYEGLQSSIHAPFAACIIFPRSAQSKEIHSNHFPTPTLSFEHSSNLHVLQAVKMAFNDIFLQFCQETPIRNRLFLWSSFGAPKTLLLQLQFLHCSRINARSINYMYNFHERCVDHYHLGIHFSPIFSRYLWTDSSCLVMAKGTWKLQLPTTPLGM